MSGEDENTMVVDQRGTAAQELVDTHGMVVVHRAFRRESELLIRLIGDTAPGDVGRARVLAAHLRWYQRGLHNHHHGEDTLIWPLLHERVAVDGEIVTRMEQQHQRISETLEAMMAATATWRSTPAADARDRLVRSLSEHRTVLLEHLDDEEAHLLPLGARHLNEREWNRLGEHFVRATPKSQLLIFLGAVLEDADPAERAALLGAMPAPARTVWRTVGRVQYARHVRRVRRGAI